jgi:hypothetical protein
MPHGLRSLACLTLRYGGSTEASPKHAGFSDHGSTLRLIYI